MIAAEPTGCVVRDGEHLDGAGLAQTSGDLRAQCCALTAANRLADGLGRLDGLIGAADLAKVDPVLDTVGVELDDDVEPAHRFARMSEHRVVRERQAVELPRRDGRPREREQQHCTREPDAEAARHDADGSPDPTGHEPGQDATGARSLGSWPTTRM